jgi:hypothetical protein
MGHKIGRNDPCPCGSGKKYKKCCLAQDEEKLRSKIDNKPDIRRKNLYNNKDYDDLDAAPPVPYDQELSDDDNDDEHPGSKDIAAQYTCRQFERDIPEIGDDQQKLIEDWLLQYNKIPRKDDNSPSLIKDHLVRFLDQHPDLAVNFSPEDIIFTLETSYLIYGNYDEFVAFLTWYRDNFLTAYNQAAPYFDLYLITYNLVQGKKEDIPELFTFFKTYPDDDADNLARVMDLLKAADEENLLMNLLEDIYLQVFYSPKLMRSYDFVEPILARTCCQHLRKDYRDIDLDALIADVKSLSDKVPDMGIYTSREYWNNFLEEMYVKIPSADFPSGREGIKSYYQNITLRFRLFLHDAKKKSWVGADHLSRSVADFLFTPISKNKRPKSPFKFTADLIERHILDDHRSFGGTKSISAISFLQALYYFAEYLHEENLYTADDRKNLEEMSLSLFKRIYDSYAPSEYGVRIFKNFPS